MQISSIGLNVSTPATQSEWRSDEAQLMIYGAASLLGVTAGALTGTVLAHVHGGNKLLSGVSGGAVGGLATVIATTYALLALQD